jgi:hypothetical protein
LPFNNGGVFGDSMLVQSNNHTLFSNTVGGDAAGFYIDNNSGTYIFGDVDGAFLQSRILITSDGDMSTNSSKLILNADNEINMNGLLTSVGAGGSAGLHLKLTINGTKYKIQLLDD